jgi:hypothetical protein
MKSRWLINIVLLLLIVAIAVFLRLDKKSAPQAVQGYEVSALKLASFDAISIEHPTKAAVVLKKENGLWALEKPYKARTNQKAVYAILSILAARSTDKFTANDPAKYGLDSPELKLRLNDELFIFGTHNPVTGDQYVSYKEAVYLLPPLYAENAEIQIVELLDKSPITATEKITGFDFSHLEQWQATGLKITLDNKQWTSSITGAKIDQKVMQEWFESYWTNMQVQSVEPYTPNRQETFPSFEVQLADGKKVHFDKLQESPELILARPDEGIQYHIASDIGFVLLNPPLTMPGK